MREELPTNEDVIFVQQNEKIINSRGDVENIQRRYVNTTAIIIGLVAVLGSLCLWLLRLLDIVSLPG